MENINEIARRLRELRLSKNLEQTDVADYLGYKSFTTISKWENGKNLPTGGKLAKLAILFNTTTDYILYGEQSTLDSQPSVDNHTQAPDELVTAINDKVVQLDQKLKEPRHSDWINYGERLLDAQETEEHSADTVEEPTVTYYTYNYYDQPASAGTGQYLNDVQVETIELPVDIDADFVVPIYGDSMEPEYHSGDYVFVKLSVNLSDGDIGVFEYNSDAYIKQLIINKNGAFLHSLNTAKYKDIPIDAESNFRIIGEVVGSFQPSEG